MGVVGVGVRVGVSRGLGRIRWIRLWLRVLIVNMGKLRGRGEMWWLVEKMGGVGKVLGVLE